MRNFLKKALAIGIATTMMMTSFTACSGKSGREKIDSDTPWFNVSKTSIGGDVDPDQFEYVYSSLVGTNGDELVYHFSGTYKLPADFDFENDDFSLYQFELINVYDYDGNILGSIDLVDTIQNAHFDGQVSVDNVVKEGTEFIVKFAEIAPDFSSRTEYQALIDISSFEVLPFTEVVQSEAEAEILNREGGTYSDTFHVGDYTIKTYWVADSVTSNILLLTDSSNNETTVDLRRVFPNLNVYSINKIIDIGNGRGLMMAYTSASDSTTYYVLDTNTASVTTYEEDMSWLEESAYNLRYVDGYGTVVVDQEGIRGIDFDNHTLVSILSFNNTNVNRRDVNDTNPVFISDDRIVLEGTNSAPTIEYTARMSCIYVFDRAESNPNAGKSILKLASLGSYNYSICDSMCRFNESNPDYFIQIDTRYVIDKFFESNNGEDYTIRSERAQQALGNQLTVDLIAGVGPDIIVDGASYSQLNNADYLLDLSDYVAGLDSSSYFTNIIDEARTDGQIFQLPVTYYVEGIVTDAANVTPGQVGFTYDEYLEFINTVCNGRDAVGSSSQTDFFLLGLTLMPDLMTVDGSVNYNNDAFISLAEFTRDHIYNAIETGEEDYIEEEPAAHLQHINDMFSYLNSIMGYANERALLGLPTYDGRGPLVSSFNSVGVVANLSSNDQAACLEYVSFLIDDDTQYQLGIEAGIPINRNAFTAVGEDFVDMYNTNLEMSLANMSEAQIRANGKNPNPLDYSTIAEFENLITTTGTWVTTDGAINAIIREEIPAYFEGQKTLEQIIEVLENRIHTMVNERG
ncbi:MAG: extracellular solute-binding protein [Saccharofermentans sp.]|nr:extracellular solute-binding protein [Saccharofermentans sp.]